MHGLRSGQAEESWEDRNVADPSLGYMLQANSCMRLYSDQLVEEDHLVGHIRPDLEEVHAAVEDHLGRPGKVLAVPTRREMLANCVRKSITDMRRTNAFP